MKTIPTYPTAHTNTHANAHVISQVTANVTEHVNTRANAHTQGFTLIELVIMIIVFFGSVVALLSVSREAAQRVADVDASSRAMQYAQERAEMVLADRRNPNRNYAYVPLQSASCASVSATCAYPIESPLSGTSLVRSVQITDASANPLCPDPTSGCKLVLVTLSRNGRSVATVTLLLVNS